MKEFILLYIFFASFIGYSQVDIVNLDFIPNVPDSIHFCIWEVQNKEMSLPGQEESEYERELGRKALNKKDIQLFVTNLKNVKSYDQLRALPDHYNLVLYIFDEGIISSEIRISTMTGNINVDSKLTDVFFRNHCSDQMGKVLVKLLKKYNFLEVFDEVELMGISTYNND